MIKWFNTHGKQNNFFLVIYNQLTISSFIYYVICSSYHKLKLFLYFLTIHYFAEKMGFANDLLQRKDGNGYFLKVWNLTKVNSWMRFSVSCFVCPVLEILFLHEFMLGPVVWIILLTHAFSGDASKFSRSRIGGMNFFMEKYIKRSITVAKWFCWWRYLLWVLMWVIRY